MSSPILIQLGREKNPHRGETSQAFIDKSAALGDVMEQFSCLMLQLNISCITVEATDMFNRGMGITTGIHRMADLGRFSNFKNGGGF